MIIFLCFQTYMGREAYERMTTLPPMSSFHQEAIQSQRFHHASPVSSPLTSNDPSVLGRIRYVWWIQSYIFISFVLYSRLAPFPTKGSPPLLITAQASRSGSGSQAIGKALASVYLSLNFLVFCIPIAYEYFLCLTFQIYSDSTTNYSSNPPTPIASPPPLTSINDRPLSAGSSNSAPGSWPRPNLQAMPSPPGPYESHLHSLVSLYLIFRRWRPEQVIPNSELRWKHGKTTNDFIIFGVYIWLCHI